MGCEKTLYLVCCRSSSFPLPPSRLLLPGAEALGDGVQGHLLAGILQQLHQPHDLPVLQQRVPARLHAAPAVSVSPQEEAPAPLLRPEVADSCQGNDKGSEGRLQVRLRGARVLRHLAVSQGKRAPPGLEEMEPLPAAAEVLFATQRKGEQPVEQNQGRDGKKSHAINGPD